MNLIGVDVDSRTLVCERRCNNKSFPIKTFANTTAGHKKFIRWATQRGATARVAMEATGVYSIPFALALSQAEGIGVSVVNPRAIKKFADATLQRGKTDAMDASCIAEYLVRMPFKEWVPPDQVVMQLQHITRRTVQLGSDLTREKSRLAAAKRLGSFGSIVANDTAVSARHIQRRIDALEAKALKLVAANPALQHQLNLLVSVVGIGNRTGLRILAELNALPSDMKAKQWVAFAGLDPRPFESGTSTKKPRSISRAGNRYLRDALYFPALVASQQDEHVSAYYQKLLAAGKKPKQAIVAIMRKMLLALWGMLHTGTSWDGSKFYKMA
jgi:transposase